MQGVCASSVLTVWQLLLVLRCADTGKCVVIPVLLPWTRRHWLKALEPMHSC